MFHGSTLASLVWLYPTTPQGMTSLRVFRVAGLASAPKPLAGMGV